MEIVDVLDELVDSANALGIIAPSFGTSKGKAYEVWVMLEIVVRLQKRGVNVLPLDSDGNFERIFRVSGSPSNMPPSGGKGGGPCHFALYGRRCRLELHLGLNYVGGSTSTHEFDLSVVSKREAKALRDKGGGPFTGQPLVGVELKAYTEKHKLDHGVPRALIGVAIDLDPWLPAQRLTLTTTGGSDHYLTRTRRMRLSLLTTTKLHHSSATYLKHYGVGAHSSVTPTSNVVAIKAIVSEIYNLCGGFR
ncbi:hypothetical protein ABEB22_10840 [Thioclava sp. 'Guangxiensis']|uniref:hypothetical protein n=1 Tax=Thioclava sp. 'Guangxiensis' TaxID=3149044 RepID=UPI003877AFF8